jgi:CHAT domain-containing protein
MFGRNRKRAEAQIREKLASANTHFDSGFLDAGLEIAMSALELAQKRLKPKNAAYTQSLSKVAEGYFLMGLYDESFSFYIKSLEILSETRKPSDPDHIACLYSLAGIYKALGDQNQEDIVLRSIVRIELEEKGDSHPDYAGALYAVSDLYRRAGQYKMAQAGYEAVSEIYSRQKNGSLNGLLAECSFGIAACLVQAGEYARAEPFFREALETFRELEGDSYAPVADILQNLGAIYAYNGDPKRALETLESAENIYDHRVRHIFSRTSNDLKRLFIDQMMASVSRFLSLTLQYFPEDPEVAEKALILVGKRKALGLDSQLFQRDTFAQSDDPEVRSQWERMETLRSLIAQKAMAGMDASQDYRTHLSKLMEWETEAQEIERSLLEKTGFSIPGDTESAFSRQRLDKVLPGDTALVEFIKFRWFEYRSAKPEEKGFRGKTAYLALVYVSGKTACIHLGDAEKIDQAIGQFRTSITGAKENPDRAAGRKGKKRELIFAESGQTESLGETGSEVYKLLVAPILKSLHGKTKLLIATDGELSRLPFDAIPDGKDAFLIDRYRISYLGTARDLLRQTSAPGKACDPVVMASPDFDLSKRKWSKSGTETLAASPNGEALRSRQVQFAPLPGTQKEGKEVAKLLKVKPLLEKSATKAELLSCRSPLILHLATHGFFLPSSGSEPGSETEMGRLSNATGMQALRSGLALAGANTWLQHGSLPEEAMDGILNSEDAARLRLAGTELVVLSACETGLGYVLDGEGVYGLSRAFSLAGAETLVLSLWKVPDQQTQDMMVRFYRLILSGKGRAESLREARLAIRQEFPDPYFWGAFICRGETGPIPYLP